MNVEPVKRRYDATRRQAQARQLRLEVAAAARGLFIERGYAATTIADIAASAGVSQQFIYAAFGGKRGLLEKVVDWTLVGDDEPIPMAQRSTIIAVQQERSLAGKCALYARHGRMIAPRISPLVHVLRSAADADPDARLVYNTREEQRRIGATLFVADLRNAGDLRAGLSDDQAADAVWALAPDVLWNVLVTGRGWAADAFEVWYAGQLAAAVLEERYVGPARRFSRRLIADA